MNKKERRKNTRMVRKNGGIKYSLYAKKNRLQKDCTTVIECITDI